MINKQHTIFSLIIVDAYSCKLYNYKRILIISLLVSFAIFLKSCTDDPELPTVRTFAPSEITRNTVIASGQVLYDGGSPVLGKGFCWSIYQNPDFTDYFTAVGEGAGPFSAEVTGLTPNTRYYIRAYATNSIGTAFGEEISFTTAPVVLGTIATVQPASITRTTAISGGNITLDGGGEITQRGVCWSACPDPEITDSLTKDGTGKGEFESSITALAPGTKYYIRAYAINSAGVAYGSQFSFNTKIADIQGNLYNTVTIGSQVWMVENLRTTKYNNNTNIPNVQGAAAWINLTTPAYCWFANDIGKASWGALYNWFTVQTGRLCPTGWHVPTDDEFKILETYLGMTADQLNEWEWRGTDEGNKLKSATGWKAGENGTNSSGFTALPYGYRYGATGSFDGSDMLTYWWSTEYNAQYGYYRRVDGPESRIHRSATSKKGGKYVRCLKN